MTTIVTRAGKGTTLSWSEADANFTNLNTDKLETSTVGVSVQAYSSNLDEYATVNPTAAGLALLDDATAADQRTTLGLGNVDNTSDSTKNSATATLTNKTLTSPKIKAGQFGDSNTATNNFTITAEAADGTMKLARGNAGATTQDVMTVDATGKVKFPQTPVPAFTATINTQSVGTSLGQLTCTEVFDPLNQFASNQYTPQVAGLYQVSLAAVNNVNDNWMFLAIALNGSVGVPVYMPGMPSGFGGGARASISALIRMNGTTDYLSAFGGNSIAGFSIVSGAFSAVLVRAD